MAYMRDSTGRRLDSFAVAPTDVARTVAVPFATKVGPQFDSGVGLSDGVILGGTARLSHEAFRSVFGVRLAFTNWYSGASNVETDGLNNITVRAAVEAIATAPIPVTFNGARSVVIEPGCTVWSDPVGVDILKGATFFTRTYVTVTTGQKFPRCGYYVSAGNEGQNYANPAGADTTVSATTLSGVGTGNIRVYGPAAILGYPSDPGQRVWGILGDSIAHGSGDGDYGFPLRALNKSYAHLKVAFPGEPLVWQASQGKVRHRRVGLLAGSGITHVLFEYGVNSVGSASLQADAVTSWRTFRGAVKAYQTTLTPQTTSTDAWATTANQTLLKTTAQEASRVAFNAWLRDGAPIDTADAPQAPGATGAGIVRAGQAGHPLAGWFEIADLAESSRDSGKWKPGYTSDGTHPNATGAPALAAGFNPAVA